MMMNPIITEIVNKKFAGIKICIRESLQASNNMLVVPSLWPKLLALNLSQRVGGERYALITGDLPDQKQPQAYYYALVAVSTFDGLSDEIVKFEISNARLAKFTHRGSPAEIGKTAMRALMEWLPQSKQTIAENNEFMIFPENYDRANPNAEFEFCLFIK